MEITIKINGRMMSVEVNDEVAECYDQGRRKAENLSHEKRRHWDEREFDEYIVATEGLLPYQPTLEDIVCQRETLDLLLSILDTCTPIQRDRFLLYALYDYTYDESLAASVRWCYGQNDSGLRLLVRGEPGNFQCVTLRNFEIFFEQLLQNLGRRTWSSHIAIQSHDGEATLNEFKSLCLRYVSSIKSLQHRADIFARMTISQFDELGNGACSVTTAIKEFFEKVHEIRHEMETEHEN